MKTILGISDTKKAHFYLVDTTNLGSYIKELKENLSFENEEVAICEFFTSKIHDFGRFQQLIKDERVKVLQEKVLTIDKKKPNEEVRLGEVKVKLFHESIIADAIKKEFLPSDTYNEYHLVDLTKLMKVSNYINNRDNNFSYDGTIDNKIVMNNISNIYRNLFVNKEVYLNDKENKLTKDEYTSIINGLAHNIDFKYIGSLDNNEEYDEDYEIMKRFALRNEKLLEYETLHPILQRLFYDALSEKYIDLTTKNISLPNYSLDGRVKDFKEYILKK